MTSSRPAVGKCRSCGHEVVWAITSTGKKMPMDVPNDPKGTFVLFALADGDNYRAEKFSAENPAHSNLKKRFTSHFATCPQADAHRRSR